jgi:hypothetical protein
LRVTTVTDWAVSISGVSLLVAEEATVAARRALTTICSASVGLDFVSVVFAPVACVAVRRLSGRHGLAAFRRQGRCGCQK